MSVETIIEPSADEQKVAMYNQKMIKGKLIPISANQKWACVLLPVNAEVDQPGDYPTLANEIGAIPGLGIPVLLIDRRVETEVPEGYELMLAVTAQIRMHKIPEQELEEK